MGLRADIQTTLREVVGSTDNLGATWQYRALTNGPATQSPTYGSWTDIVGHLSGQMNNLDYDQDSGATTRMERARFRVSDASTILKQGDQLKDTASKVWAVVGVDSSGIGSVAYAIEYQVPLKAGPDRRGGI